MKFSTVSLSLGVAVALTANAYASSLDKQSATPDATKVASSEKMENGHAAKIENSHGAKKSGGHWAYTGSSGPKSWGTLSQDYHVCRDGKMQSPIDIANGFSGEGDAITFDYKLSPLTILHNGHTVQVNYAPGSSITVNGKNYSLLQFHFHTPSEHAVGGKRASMEVHFVHRSDDGELAVVGAMMEGGDENLPLREIWASMPTSNGPARTNKNVLINGGDLLPENRRYHRYMGSLTTPPCSEGVNWFVLTEPISVSDEQISKFAKAVGKNSRPLQARNNRLLLTPNSGNGFAPAAGK